MAKDTLTHEQREIVRAQNDALLRLPKDRDDRLALIHGYRREKALENDKIAQAKKDVGSSETLKRLTGTYGLKPQAIKTINLLAEMAPTDRSAALRQIINHGSDEGWIIPDLFDMGAIGVGSNDEAGQTAGFDGTGEGQRRGGKKAQPRSLEQMAASHQTAPTPGVPLDEAVKQLEAFRAANPPKRGRKPAELVRLEAQVEAARTAHNDAEAAPAAEDAPEAEIADLPEAKPGEITQGLKEANAEGDAHIRRVAEQGPSAPPTAMEGAPATEKPKRASRKKAGAEAAPAAEAAPPAPPPPPAEDDEDEAPQPGLPAHRPDAIGAAPASFRMG